jgi:small subunit ribosomal protein S27Ae
MPAKSTPKKDPAKPAKTEVAAPSSKGQKTEMKKAEMKKEAHKEKKGVCAMFKAEGNKVTRTHPTCERCGTGYFMADHHDRYTCGHCGFTRYKPK